MRVRDSLRSHLSEPGALRACLLGVVVLSLALLAVWPRGTLDDAVRTGQAPDMFSVVSVCFLLILLYLGARFGAEDLAAGAGPQLHEYAALTPVSPAWLVLSRFVEGTIHTLFLLLLGTPILIASMSVGGVGFSQVVAVLLLVGSASLAARMGGLLALTLAGARRALRGFIMVAAIAAAAAVTFILTPRVNPFHVLASLSQGPDRAVAWLPCAAASVGAALVLAAGALAVLAGWRSRARRRAREGS
jgi:hypothetical protein